MHSEERQDEDKGQDRLPNETLLQMGKKMSSADKVENTMPRSAI